MTFHKIKNVTLGGRWSKNSKSYQPSLWTPPKYTKFRSAWKISLEVWAHESLMTLFWWKIFLWGESFFFARYFIMGPEERDLWEKYNICENYYWLSIDFTLQKRYNRTFLKDSLLLHSGFKTWGVVYKEIFVKIFLKNIFFSHLLTSLSCPYGRKLKIHVRNWTEAPLYRHILLEKCEQMDYQFQCLIFYCKNP